jgi:hypothetical protein
VEFPIVERIATVSERDRVCEFLQARLTGAPPDSCGTGLDPELNADRSSEFEVMIISPSGSVSGSQIDIVIPQPRNSVEKQRNSE